MIQLANDPNASRSFERDASSSEAKGAAAADRRVRSGHAWPFLSRMAAPAAKESSDKPAAQHKGS
jgi:hypothetical protein